MLPISPSHPSLFSPSARVPTSLAIGGHGGADLRRRQRPDPSAPSSTPIPMLGPRGGAAPRLEKVSPLIDAMGSLRG
jgi:hypothetical protein